MAIEINTLARPYARAAFEFALESGAIKSWADFLTAASCVTVDAHTVALLQNPSVSPDIRAEFYCDVLSSVVNDEQRNFLRLLSSYHRLAIMPRVAELFNEYRATYEKTLTVTAISCQMISEAQKKAIAAKLTQRLLRKIHVETEIDPTLIGGIIIRAGDQVIDGSLKGRFTKLREQLIA